MYFSIFLDTFFLPLAQQVSYFYSETGLADKTANPIWDPWSVMLPGGEDLQIPLE